MLSLSLRGLGRGKTESRQRLTRPVTADYARQSPAPRRNRVLDSAEAGSPAPLCGVVSVGVSDCGEVYPTILNGLEFLSCIDKAALSDDV